MHIRDIGVHLHEEGGCRVHVAPGVADLVIKIIRSPVARSDGVEHLLGIVGIDDRRAMTGWAGNGDDLEVFVVGLFIVIRQGQGNDSGRRRHDVHIIPRQQHIVRKTAHGGEGATATGPNHHGRLQGAVSGEQEVVTAIWVSGQFHIHRTDAGVAGHGVRVGEIQGEILIGGDIVQHHGVLSGRGIDDAHG